MRLLSCFLFVLMSIVNLCAQNKSAYTWVVGSNAALAQFDGTNSKPNDSSLINASSNTFPSYFSHGKSNICDSSSGDLLFMCNGMRMFNRIAEIMENGDSLVPKLYYEYGAYPVSGSYQSSLILPRGSNGEYYVFIPAYSDSAFDLCINNPIHKCSFDMILYNVVDMNFNGGLGKVVVKNKVLVEHVFEMNKVMMQACRHANGVDWWLLKQGGYNKNELIRFLVTKDSIYGPYYQSFIEPKYSYWDLRGQMCFSPNGKKFASVQGFTNKLFLADFDRCSGELSNPQVFNLPYDSTGFPPYDSQGVKDSLSGGVCFSPNNNFLYISKGYNIYQYEINEIDSNLAWYNVKRGTDTSDNMFELYAQLLAGVDNRIYIGKWHEATRSMSVIDYPDLKGSACGFCRKCFRVEDSLARVSGPPNVPDFNLGADSSLLPCWPLDTGNVTKESEWVVYPNPANTTLIVKNRKGKKKELFNSVGQVIYATTKEVIDVSGLAKGVYFIKVEGEVKKVVVE